MSPAALLEHTATMPLALELRTRKVFVLPSMRPIPSSVRVIRVFADRRAGIRILDSGGKDHFPSFARSFRNLLVKFPELIAPCIEWFPIRDSFQVCVHKWWDWDWVFHFVAGPFWHLDRVHGGPFDFGGLSDLEVDTPIILVVRAKRTGSIPGRKSAKGKV